MVPSRSVLGAAAWMDDEHRFFLDLNGYLHLQNVLSPRELVACRAAADRHIALCEAVVDGSAAADAVPEGFGNGAKPGEPGGKGYSNGFAWEKPLEQLLFHHKLWPIVRFPNRIRHIMRHHTSYHARVHMPN